MKIVRLKLPSDAIDRIHDNGQRPGKVIRTLQRPRADVDIHWRDDAQGGLLSQPLDGDKADSVLDMMNALLEETQAGELEVMDITSEYRLVRTYAPADYDWAYVVPVRVERDPSGKEARVVAIPKGSYEFQVGRYRSGLHGVQDVKE